MTFEELKPQLVTMLITGLVSVVSTFFITVNEVSANGEQGKRNAEEIKEVQKLVASLREEQSAIGAKIDLLVERAKLGR